MVIALGAKVLCAAATLFVASTSSYGNQVPRESECLTVNQTKTFCLENSGSSSSVDRSLPLTCPVGFYVIVFTASVYLSPAAAAAAADGDDGCPSELQTESIRCFELNKRTYRCSGNKCSIIVPVSTSDDLCDEGQLTGRRYAVVVYRCQPEFSPFANATATALALDSDVIASNPLIAVNNDVLALTGVYSPAQTPLFCSGVLPRNSQASLRLLLMMVEKPTNEGDWTSVNVDVITSSSSSSGGEGGGGGGRVDRHRFRSVDDPPHVLIGCSPVDRLIRISVTSNNSNASILFALNLQVSYLSEITMQCNSPPTDFPLSSSTEKPTKTEISRITTTSPFKTGGEEDPSGFPLLIVAVVCGVGGLITTVVVIIVIVVVWHRSKIRFVSDHRPLSETSSLESSVSSMVGKEALGLQIETHSKPQILKE